MTTYHVEAVCQECQRFSELVLRTSEPVPLMQGVPVSPRPCPKCSARDAEWDVHEVIPQEGPDRLRAAINCAVERFEDRWGPLEHTVSANLWQDGDDQIEVFHTAGRFELTEDYAVVRRLSTLLEGDGTVEHREYIQRPAERQETLEHEVAADGYIYTGGE